MNMTVEEFCERFGDPCQVHLQGDHDLEHQGVYFNEKAKDMYYMACYTLAGFAKCTPGRCLSWRRVDDTHGYCVFIGCSWREGVPL